MRGCIGGKHQHRSGNRHYSAYWDTTCCSQVCQAIFQLAPSRATDTTLPNVRECVGWKHRHYCGSRLYAACWYYSSFPRVPRSLTGTIIAGNRRYYSTGSVEGPLWDPAKLETLLIYILYDAQVAVAARDSSPGWEVEEGISVNVTTTQTLTIWFAQKLFVMERDAGCHLARR